MKYFKYRGKTSVFWNGDIYSLNTDNITEAQLEILLPTLSIQSFLAGKFHLVDNTFYKDGVALHSAISDKLVESYNQRTGIDHILKFLAKLDSNPSELARLGLLQWLSHTQLPITEDGNFIAYKSVRPTMYDIYSNTISNHIGAEVSMDRELVDSNSNNYCSVGLHFSSIDYARNYGGIDSILIKLEIDPKDVVSFPTDSHTKGRTCSYKVISKV